MFKNLLNNPDNVTSFELNCLNQRRKTERQIILDQEVEEDEEEDESELDKMWFMISKDWLVQWKSFISNKISRSQNATLE